MPRMSKKRKQEWSFFLRQTQVGAMTFNRITYNDLCRKCVHDCKQSFRATVIECPRYCSKRSKGTLPCPPSDEPYHSDAAQKGCDG